MTLAELIESGEFDWDDEKHRNAYLKAWAAGREPEKPVAEPAGNHP